MAIALRVVSFHSTAASGGRATCITCVVLAVFPLAVSVALAVTSSAICVPLNVEGAVTCSPASCAGVKVRLAPICPAS